MLEQNHKASLQNVLGDEKDVVSKNAQVIDPSFAAGVFRILAMLHIVHAFRRRSRAQSVLNMLKTETRGQRDHIKMRILQTRVSGTRYSGPLSHNVGS